jgi:parallel beta-helix repeat protein
MITRTIFSLTIFLLSCRVFPQITRYVSPDGNDLWNGSFKSPYRTIQAAVDRSLPGTIIYIRKGVYRESIELYTNGVKLWAYNSEKPVIKGSVVMSGWTRRGSFWKKYVKIQPQQVMVNGDNPLQQIGYPNSDFQNNQSYSRYEYPVGYGLADMAPGRFFWQSDTLFIMLSNGSDPNKSTIEVSQLQRLLFIRGDKNSIKGLTFRHTNANTFDEFGAAVTLGNNTTLEDCDIQWCDFGGVSMGLTGSKAIRCNASNNGATGFNASASFNFLISECKANNNNYRNFYAQWHAGGFKGTIAAWGTIENSEFAYNIGAGIWFDYCYEMKEYRSDGPKPIIIRNNYIHDNSKTSNKNSALMLEVTERASCQNNLVINNDYRGIYVASSWDCDIINNTVAYTQLYHGIDLHGMPREGAKLVNNYVANNILYNNNTEDDIEVLNENGRDVMNNTCDHNVIFRQNGGIKLRYGMFTWRSLEKWKKNVPFTDNSISVDPGFIDNRYHLGPDSPVIDAGTGPVKQSSEKDFDGNARLVGDRIDPGIHEFQGLKLSGSSSSKLNP